MKITWIGHSCFKLSNGKYSVVMDPYADGSVPGLKPVRESADLVLCSHEHHDHNARETVEITATAETVAGETVVGSATAADAAFEITTIETFHDPEKGTLRGNNTIHIIEEKKIDADGTLHVFKAAHLGDLGCDLEPEQKEQLKNLDALLIPVGGFFTIDALQAAALVKELAPRMVIPMHFRDDEKGFGFDAIGRGEDFVEAIKEVGLSNVIRYESGSFDTGSRCDCGQPGSTVVVLTPQNL